ncbi:MAG: DUF1559 domain-containing protein [Planctomycetaceae bacterium]|nr:DUF1559 domain-containing protein [Planctomycetaceae bacterium]
MKRSAFTLVELLVVIGVIGILIAILIPTVGAAREHARRTQCITKQRDLAIVMKTHDGESNGLPGYLNQLGTAPIRSWVVSILPLIGESKRYEYMMEEPPDSAKVEQAVAPLPALLCPSDRPMGEARINYVVNCGPATEHFLSAPAGISSGDIAPHYTLYKDRRREPDDLTLINRKVKIEDIPDGASSTLLLTENVNNAVENLWHLGTTAHPDELPTGAVSPILTRDSVAVLHLGFTWVPAWATGTLPTDYAPNSPAKGPRPSSRHPGIIVVAFADGSARALNDTISKAEWFKLVCPDNEKAAKPFSAGGLNP